MKRWRIALLFGLLLSLLVGFSVNPMTGLICLALFAFTRELTDRPSIAITASFVYVLSKLGVLSFLYPVFLGTAFIIFLVGLTRHGLNMWTYVWPCLSVAGLGFVNSHFPETVLQNSLILELLVLTFLARGVRLMIPATRPEITPLTPPSTRDHKVESVNGSGLPWLVLSGVVLVAMIAVGLRPRLEDVFELGYVVWAVAAYFTAQGVATAWCRPVQQAPQRPSPAPGSLPRP